VSDREGRAKWERYRKERNDKLDALLRKIHKVGVDHLSTEEVRFLERVSGEMATELDLSGGG
jgi:hypothetical protein